MRLIDLAVFGRLAMPVWHNPRRTCRDSDSAVGTFLRSIAVSVVGSGPMIGAYCPSVPPISRRCAVKPTRYSWV